MTDRRYGVNKYGSGSLYGASDAREALAWGVSIDWDGDTVLEENEADLMTKVSVERGRKRMLKSSGAGFEKIGTGKVTVELLNRDGRFDGWNTSSPIYPNVDNGKEIRVRVRNLNDTADPYPVFRGVIDEIKPVGSGRDARVQITAYDGLEFLRNTDARVAIQESITPDEAMGLVLDAAGWPSHWGRALTVSSETIPYWWASGNKKAMSELEDLAISFLGNFFVDAMGRAKFITRSSITNVVQEYLQEQIGKDIGNPQPRDVRRNVTRLKVHPRTAAATGVIWQLLGTTPSILTGSDNALTMFANYAYANTPTPANNVISPVATTDFTTNTQPDGSGTDKTADCTVTMTDFGDTAKLVITNNSGGTVYITKLQVRGDAIYEPNVSDITYPKDVSTVSQRRELLFDLLWQQDLNVARDIADVLGPFYASLHPLPSIPIDNRPALQFGADLFDIVTADIEYLGLTGVSFRIGGIEHKSDTKFENCQRILSRIYLEPYIAAGDFMQWDTNAVWDTSTVFGW
jgi:hypothetical protein